MGVLAAFSACVLPVFSSVTVVVDRACEDREAVRRIRQAIQTRRFDGFDDAMLFMLLMKGPGKTAVRGQDRSAVFLTVPDFVFHGM